MQLVILDVLGFLKADYSGTQRCSTVVTSVIIAEDPLFKTAYKPSTPFTI